MAYVELSRANSAIGEVVLRRRLGPEPAVELRVNGVFVMDDRLTDTERALAVTALACTSDPRRVLIGGLGLGFTLREVLRDPRIEHCTVVEIAAALVGWLADGTIPGGPELLTDPRLDVQVGDVWDVVGSIRGGLDLILLDVDNGPGYLVHDHNSRLYGSQFWQLARTALRPGGVCGVWSAGLAPALAEELGTVFAGVERIDCPVDLQGRRECYYLYLARR